MVSHGGLVTISKIKNKKFPLTDGRLVVAMDEIISTSMLKNPVLIMRSTSGTQLVQKFLLNMNGICNAYFDFIISAVVPSSPLGLHHKCAHRCRED